MSTTFHPETDGQTEKVNQILEQYIRSYCSYQQDDWASLLPLAEYAYNTSLSESSKAMPYEINYGFTPSVTNLTKQGRFHMTNKLLVIGMFYVSRYEVS